MGVVSTGVFATEAERGEMAERSRDIYSTPLIFPNGMLSALAMDSVVEAFATRIDELAQAHGLPSPGLIGGDVSHYGMAKSGEFTRWEPEPTT